MTTVSSPRAPGQRRWRRYLLLAIAALAIGGPLSAYVGYRMMFRKNPEVVRQIRAAETRQQELEAAFARPVVDEPAARAPEPRPVLAPDRSTVDAPRPDGAAATAR